MNNLKFVAFILTSFLLFSCAKKEQNVCGTWKMIEGNYEGPDFSVKTDAEKRICYKILSENHFAVIEMYMDNPDSMFFAAVGTYQLLDSTYIETYEASNVPTKIGEKMEFHSTLHDKTWKISLNKDDLFLEETWICLKAAPGNEHGK